MKTIRLEGTTPLEHRLLHESQSLMWCITISTDTGGRSCVHDLESEREKGMQGGEGVGGV